MSEYNNIVKQFLKSFKLRSENCFYDCEHEPHEIAFKGKASFYIPPYPHYNIKGYKSKVLKNSTYKQIFNLCEEYIKKTGNPQDRFFTEVFKPENNADNIDIFDYNINNIDIYLEEQKKPFILDPKRVYNIEMRMEPMGDRIDRFMISEIIKT